jgi:hypothetical protein
MGRNDEREIDVAADAAGLKLRDRLGGTGQGRERWTLAAAGDSSQETDDGQKDREQEEGERRKEERRLGSTGTDTHDRVNATRPYPTSYVLLPTSYCLLSP